MTSFSRQRYRTSAELRAKINWNPYNYGFNNLNQLTNTWTGTNSSAPITQTNYGYDNLGRLSTTTEKYVNGSSVNLPTSNSYDADGNLGREVLPNGVTDTYTYDTLNRLVGDSSVSPTLGTLYSDQYQLYPDGTRAVDDYSQQFTNGFQSSTAANPTVDLEIDWTYDNDNRLIEEHAYDATGDSTTDPGSFENNYTYTYDLAGNRLIQSGPQTVTNFYNHDNQLTSSYSSSTGWTTNTYDANGSLTTSTNGTTTTYTYDLRNKMVGFATNGTTQATYVYDDAGNRVQEVISGATNYYLTDIQNPTGYAQPIEVWTLAPSARSGQVPQMTYVLGDRVLWQVDGSGNIEYYITDGHGSTVATTDSSGNLLGTFDYNAFGVPVLFDSTAAAPIFLFGGDAVFDPVSGLYMNGDGTRDREASTGDFIEADTQGNGNPQNPLSQQLYLYGGDDPTNMWDPSGHELGEVLVDAGISSLIDAAITPIVKPAATIIIGALANALLNSSVIQNMENAMDACPAELMLGGDLMGGGGYGGVSITGGISFEALLGVNFNAGYFALNYFSISGGGGGSRIRGSIGLKGGIVFGADSPGSYDKDFDSVTLPIGSIAKGLLSKLEAWSFNFGSVLSTGLSDLPSLGLAAQRWGPQFEEALSDVDTFAGDVNWLSGLVNRFAGNSYVTLFWAPDGKVWGFDFSKSWGNSGTYNFTKSYYWQL